MKHKIIAASIFALALIAACSKRGEVTNVTKSADNYEVEFLFEVDNVRVYRFKDYGTTPHYFCRDMTISQQSCGKGCTYDETIQTK